MGAQMSGRQRRDGRAAWERSHGALAGGGSGCRQQGGRPPSGGSARRPRPKPAPRASWTPSPIPRAEREEAAAAAAAAAAAGAETANERHRRRREARERKLAVRQARLDTIQRRAAAAAAAREQVQDNSVLDALMGEVQDKLYQKRGKIARGFIDVFDKDRDGTLSRAEILRGMEELLNRPLTEEQADAVFQRADSNGDGEIDLNEFVSQLKIDDEQRRDIVPQVKTPSIASPASAGAAPAVVTAPERVEPVALDWLAVRNQRLAEDPPAEQVRRKMLAGTDVRASVTPPAIPRPKPVALWEQRDAEEQRRRLVDEANAERIEKGGEHERYERARAAVKQQRFQARVAANRSHRKADAERSQRVQDRREKQDAARIAAKRFIRDEWEAAARLRDFCEPSVLCRFGRLQTFSLPLALRAFRRVWAPWRPTSRPERAPSAPEAAARGRASLCRPATLREQSFPPVGSGRCGSADDIRWCCWWPSTDAPSAAHVCLDVTQVTLSHHHHRAPNTISSTKD